MLRRLSPGRAPKHYRRHKGRAVIACLVAGDDGIGNFRDGAWTGAEAVDPATIEGGAVAVMWSWSP